MLSYTKIMVTVISCFPSMFVCIFAKKNLRFSRLNGAITGCRVWSNVLNTLNIPKPCFEICGHHYPINDCSCQHLIYRTCNILSEIIFPHTLFFMFSSLVKCPAKEVQPIKLVLLLLDRESLTAPLGHVTHHPVVPSRSQATCKPPGVPQYRRVLELLRTEKFLIRRDDAATDWFNFSVII